MNVNTEVIPIAQTNIEKTTDLNIKKTNIFNSVNDRYSNKPTITIYNPFNFTFTKIVNYEGERGLLMKHLLEFEQKIFLIYQIDSDDDLYQCIIKNHFNSNFDDIHKIFESKLDFCFSPVGELLCFNVSLVSDFYFDKLEKYIVQILLLQNSIYIINRFSIELIQEIFMTKFNFKYLDKSEFFESIELIIKEESNDKKFNTDSLINGFSLKDILNKHDPVYTKDLLEEKDNVQDNIHNISEKSNKKVKDEESDNSDIDYNFSKDFSSIHSEHKHDFKNIFEKTIQKNDLKRFFDKDMKEENQSMDLIEKNPNNLKNKRKKLKKDRLSVLKTKSKMSREFKEMVKNNELLKDEIEINNKLDNYSLRISSVDDIIILYDKDHNDSFLSSTKENSENRKNFSTDDLIYNILLISLEKLEEFCEYLTRECEMLKNIYLELSQDEKDNFFKKIHSIEVSLQLLSQETFLRRKFLKFANIKFKVYNQITKNFYFNKSFNFFVEIMIARLIQIELNFKKLKNIIIMIKDNFHIILDDNQEKEDNRLNDTMKILAILTAIFTPYQVITGIYGMNIKLPYGASYHSSLIPFFCVVFFLLFLSIIQIFIFRRWKWI